VRGSRIGLAAAGALVAGVAGGLAVQRRVAGRARSGPDRYADEDFSARRGATTVVVADDGVPLQVEIDEAAPSRVGEPTIVFVHGFTLTMDCWHFQRRDLADVGRLVFYDQRSHGGSGRSPRDHATIDQLGEDLRVVLDAVAPSGPVVLVGHSMGGMSILALADRHPELFGPRVVGVALLSTAAGAFAETLFGLPGVVGRALRPIAPGVIRAVNRRADLIEQGRRQSGALAFVLVRRFAYGSEVPPSLVTFVERMIAGTPVEVMTEFFDTFLSHDKLQALPALAPVASLVLCGSDDLLTPPHNSQLIADALPDSELVVVPDAGHLVMLEHPEVVDAALRRLVDRARRRSDAASA
jgi:pimeloyl-ACP methyl ester carboxylesterase